MTISRETITRLFEEQVGRPIEPEVAQAVVGLVEGLYEALNDVEPEPIFLVEPSLAFDAAYPLPPGERSA